MKIRRQPTWWRVPRSGCSQVPASAEIAQQQQPPKTGTASSMAVWVARGGGLECPPPPISLPASPVTVSRSGGLKLTAREDHPRRQLGGGFHAAAWPGAPGSRLSIVAARRFGSQ